MTELLYYLPVGAVAGLLAGLLGLGGGLVVVSALLIVFRGLGISEEVLTHMAIGTSLASICVTSISSVRAHHAKGGVDWAMVAVLSPGIVIGVWLGVRFAAGVSGASLQMAFAVFMWVMAAQMAFKLVPSSSGHAPSRLGLFSAGGIIGWVSALFGIGGGSLAVPYLVWGNVEMRRAVAISAACGLPLAMAGALTNIYEGWGLAELPANSVGFVYLPAFFGIVVTSAPFAKVGAHWAHKLPQQRLRQIFIGILVVLGSELLVKNF